MCQFFFFFSGTAFTRAPCPFFGLCRFCVAGVEHRGHLEVWNFVLPDKSRIIKDLQEERFWHVTQTLAGVSENERCFWKLFSRRQLLANVHNTFESRTRCLVKGFFWGHNVRSHVFGGLGWWFGSLGKKPCSTYYKILIFDSVLLFHFLFLFLPYFFLHSSIHPSIY